MTAPILQARDHFVLFGMGSIVPSILMGVAFPSLIAMLTFSGLLLITGYAGLRAHFLNLRSSALVWAWCAFCVCVLISAFVSLDTRNSLASLIYLMLNLCFASIVVHYLGRGEHKTQRVLQWMLHGILFMLVLAGLHIYVFKGMMVHMPFSTLEIHEYLVMFKKAASGFLLLLPFCGYLLWRTRGVRRLLPAIAIVGIIWLIVTVESRSAMAGMIAILGTAMLMGIGVMRWRVWQVGLMLLILGFTVFLVGLYLYSTFGLSSKGVLSIPSLIIDQARQVIWREVIIMMQENFPRNLLFGVGSNALDVLDRGVTPMVLGDENAKTFMRIALHPHNWILEILIEVGYLGFFVFLSAVALSLKWAWQYRSIAPTEVMTMMTVFAAYFTSCLTNFSVWEVWWQIAFTTTAAISAGMVQSRAQSQAQLQT